MQGKGVFNGALCVLLMGTIIFSTTPTFTGSIVAEAKSISSFAPSNIRGAARLSSTIQKAAEQTYESWRYMGFITVMNNCREQVELKSKDFGRGKLVGNNAVVMDQGSVVNLGYISSRFKQGKWSLTPIVRTEQLANLVPVHFEFWTNPDLSSGYSLESKAETEFVFPSRVQIRKEMDPDSDCKSLECPNGNCRMLKTSCAFATWIEVTFCPNKTEVQKLFNPGQLSNKEYDI
eukprot:Nk52_evm61s2367 gene=Nk52_evmTU61s2367